MRNVMSNKPLPVMEFGKEYETVAASQSDQALGATGANVSVVAVGDFT